MPCHAMPKPICFRGFSSVSLNALLAFSPSLPSQRALKTNFCPLRSSFSLGIHLGFRDYQIIYPRETIRFQCRRRTVTANYVVA